MDSTVHHTYDDELDDNDFLFLSDMITKEWKRNSVSPTHLTERKKTLMEELYDCVSDFIMICKKNGGKYWNIQDTNTVEDITIHLYEHIKDNYK